MSLFECLQTAIDSNAINRNRAQVAQDLFRELETKYLAYMDPTAAGVQAGKDVKQIMRTAIEDKRRLVANQIIAARRIDGWLNTFTDIKGRNDMSAALKQLLERGDSATFENVSSVETGLRKMVFRRLDGFLNKHAKNLLGNTRDKADLSKVGLELEGRRTGDQTAYAAALALRDTFEEVRQLFNAAGGHIEKLDNWRPQGWQKNRVKQISEAEFIRDMKDTLDWGKVYDPLTRQAFGSPNHPRVDEFLGAVRESILSDGWNKIEPSFRERGRAVYNRRADHRVLHFKAGEYEKIAAKYGSPDLFDASVGYISGMVRDIALMRVLGPNPGAGLEFAIQKAKKQVFTGNNPLGDIENRVRARAGTAKNMLAIASGTTSQPEHEGWAAFFSGTRDMLTAAHLGSALLSSVSDLNTVSFASRFVGMGNSRVMKRAADIAVGRSKDDMLRTIGVLDTVLHTSASMARYTNDVFGPETTRRFATGVIRAQGLAQWTDINRNAFGMEFMGFLAENRSRGFNRLPKELQDSLKRRGITPAEWDIIRQTQLFRGSSGDFLVPDDLRHRTDIPKEQAEGLAIRLQGMIEEETEFAIPSNSLEGRALALGSSRPGTIEGEVRRGFYQFKSFGVSMMLSQIRRVQQIDTLGGKLGYATAFITSMTILGALSVQLKEAVKGRDPRDMTTATFWGQAMVQGGGFGILGDFFASGTNRFGGGFASTIAGPQVSFAQEVFNLTGGNVVDVINGKDPRIGRDLTQTLRHYMPGGSLWYARLPLERLVFDQMQKILDPEAYEHFRKLEQNQRRIGNNESFWKRGEVLPNRAPDPSSALGG